MPFSFGCTQVDVLLVTNARGKKMRRPDTKMVEPSDLEDLHKPTHKVVSGRYNGFKATVESIMPAGGRTLVDVLMVTNARGDKLRRPAIRMVEPSDLEALGNNDALEEQNDLEPTPAPVASGALVPSLALPGSESCIAPQDRPSVLTVTVEHSDLEDLDNNDMREEHSDLEPATASAGGFGTAPAARGFETTAPLLRFFNLALLTFQLWHKLALEATLFVGVVITSPLFHLRHQQALEVA
jgi:hypothetical protein